MFRWLKSRQLTILFSLFLIVAGVHLWRAGDGQRLFGVLRDFRYVYLLPMLLLAVLANGLGGYRFFVLLRPVHPVVQALGVVRLTAVSYLANFASFGKMSALSRVVLLKTVYNVSLAGGAPFVMLELLLDVICVALLFLLTVFAAQHLALLPSILQTMEQELAVAPWGIGAVLLVGLAALVVGGVWAYRRYGPQKMAGVRELWQRQNVAQIVGLSLVMWGAYYAILFFALRGMGVSAPPSTVVFLYSVSILAGLLSPFPGGLGVREVVFTASATALLQSLEGALAAILLTRLMYFLSLPILFCSIRSPKAATADLAPEVDS